MASESINFVLTKLTEQAVKEAALLRGVDKDILLLRDKLEWMQTFIQYADQERRKRANSYMALWVRQTRDVAHDVEDVLDEFLRKVDNDRLRRHSRWGWWLGITTTLITQVVVRHQLRAKMDNIKNRLQGISDHVDKYCKDQLSPKELSAAAPSKSSVSAAAWDEAVEVVGFDEESKDLEKYLLGDGRGRFVIPIVGESGIGKSTLAWKVYDSSTIRKKFDVRAWINVPPQIKENDILYFIYKRLRFETDENKLSSTENIHHALSDYLKDKRYLVMVDGLANFTTLNIILHSLPDNGKGSRVMITTRLEEKEAANADPNVKPIKIKNLGKEGSAELFRLKVCGANVFGNEAFGSKGLESMQEQLQSEQKKLQSEKEQPQSRQEKLHSKEEQQPMTFEKACNCMYEITGGLPLAIVVLAGLLRTKNIADWHKVFEQVKLRDEPKRVKRILALSFDDLPSRLKSCFLYFAGMPENFIFNAKRIVRLWAAEGFLKPKIGKTMEDVGETYLKDLISRGLVQVVEKDLNGGVWHVTIHDRIHSFAQSEAHDASFMEVHDNIHVLAAAPTRRLYLQNYTESYTPLDTTSFPKLRSILCDFIEDRLQEIPKDSTSQCCGGYLNLTKKKVRRYHALRFLSVSKFLRVIDFRGLRIDKLPDATGDLIHVRYLGLRCRSLGALPQSIEHLINLQTLDIKRSKVAKVEPGFWKIPTLRHVIANKKLEMPKSSIGALSNMQTLRGLVYSSSDTPNDNGISPLDNMVHLRYLDVSGLTEKHWDGLQAAFKKLESLLDLHLEGQDIPASELFTNFTLHRLQFLELTGEINPGKEIKPYRLPNLIRLVLKQTKVDQEFIKNISSLPSLVELVLSDESYIQDKLVFCNEGFNNVRTLVIQNLPQELEWEIEALSIPRIKTIALAGCPKLKIKLQLEGKMGLNGWMKDLKEVVVWNMPEKISIEPENNDFREKIDKVTMKAMSEAIISEIRRTGWLRTGMIASHMHNK